MVSGKLLVGSGADFNLNLSAACKADHYFSMQLMRAAIGTYAFKYFLARQMLTVAPVCNRDKPARGKRKNMTFFTECEVDKPENRGKPGKPGTDHGFPSPILFKNRGLSPILYCGLSPILPLHMSPILYNPPTEFFRFIASPPRNGE